MSDKTDDNIIQKLTGRLSAVKSFFSKSANEAQSVQSNPQEELVEDAFTRCTRELREEKEKVRSLRSQLDPARQKAEALELRAKNKPSPSVAERAKKARAESDALQTEYEQRQKNAKRLQREFDELYGKALTEKERNAQDRVLKQAQEALEKAQNNPTSTVLGRMEQRVVEKEARAAQALERKEEAPRQSVVASKAADAIGHGAKGIARAVEAAKNLALAADPSIERAYERLCKQLQDARALLDKSIEKEHQLEQVIAAGTIPRQKLATMDPEIDAIVNRSTDDTEALAELDSALRQHRLRNFFIDQRLYIIQTMVDHLLVIKLLLTALPGYTGDDLATLSSLLNSLSNYLKRNANEVPESAETDSESTDLFDDIEQLKGKVLMAYLRISKGEGDPMKEDRLAKFRNQITQLREFLSADLKRHRDQCEHWAGLAARADDEGRQFLYTAAVDRKDHSEAIVKTISQTLEVTQVAITRTADEK